jgi:hypothetical protein
MFSCPAHLFLINMDRTGRNKMTVNNRQAGE